MNEYTYTTIFQYFADDDSEGYNVVIPAFPEIITWGKTLEAAKLAAEEAIRCHIQGLRKAGESIPQDVSNDSHSLVVEQLLVSA